MIMDWQECRKKFIRDVEVDTDRIKSLLETARRRLIVNEQIRLTKESVSFVIEGYYEVIKELLTALLLKNGLRAKNHQCLIAYFYKKYPEHEAHAHFIQHLSYLRNRLNYYGEPIEYAYYEENKKTMQEIIKLLRKML